jgi:hypothetical protein
MTPRDHSRLRSRRRKDEQRDAGVAVAEEHEREGQERIIVDQAVEGKARAVSDDTWRGTAPQQAEPKPAKAMAMTSSGKVKCARKSASESSVMETKTSAG